MTAKRFTIKHFESKDWAYDNGEPMYTKDMVEMLNALYEEVMTLRMENTKMKLVFKEVVDDLQREVDTNTPVLVGQEYVDWINDNVDLRFDSDKNE